MRDLLLELRLMALDATLAAEIDLALGAVSRAVGRPAPHVPATWVPGMMTTDARTRVAATLAIFSPGA